MKIWFFISMAFIHSYVCIIHTSYSICNVNETFIYIKSRTNDVINVFKCAKIVRFMYGHQIGCRFCRAINLYIYLCFCAFIIVDFIACYREKLLPKISVVFWAMCNCASQPISNFKLLVGDRLLLAIDCCWRHSALKLNSVLENCC